LREELLEPTIQRIEQRTGSGLADFTPDIGALAPDRGFDPVQLGDSLKGGFRQRRVIRHLDIIKFAPHVSPARCFLDRMIRVGLVVELIEAGIAIRLQGAAKILQVCPRVQPFAIR